MRNRNAFMLTLFLPMLLFVLSAYSEEIHGHHHHAMDEVERHMEAEGTPDENLGICPVMRNKASKEYSYIYEGKTYYFCCPMCVEEFKNYPAKYISKIKEINLEKINKKVGVNQ